MKEQRQQNLQSTLSKERTRILNNLDFDWSICAKKSSWMDTYRTLEKFKHENGDCCVPQGYTADPSLGGWVTTQRVTKKNGSLTKEREKMLNDLEFSWSLHAQKTWKEQYHSLVLFKKRNGHCLVPQNYKTGASLGVWVAVQRRGMLKGFLTEEQEKLLNELGFEWSVLT